MYFHGKDDHFSLKARTAETVSLEIVKWSDDEFLWNQYSTNEKGKISYIVHVAEADSFYTISDGNKNIECKSDRNGLLKFDMECSKLQKPVTLTISRQYKMPTQDRGKSHDF